MSTATVAAHSHGDHYTSTSVPTWKVGFWTFIGSECLFFGTLISTYMVYKHSSVQGPFPHEILNIPLTTISTFVLLMSSLAMVLALSGIQHGNIRRFRIWIATTGLLGLVFLAGQVYEFTFFWRHEHMTLSNNLFGSTFFTLTGFHGTHVAIGVVWLFSLFLASFKKGLITQEKSLNVEIAGLYWHFVDIVWIVNVTLIYLLQ